MVLANTRVERITIMALHPPQAALYVFFASLLFIITDNFAGWCYWRSGLQPIHIITIGEAIISLGVLVLVHIFMLALRIECDYDRYLFLSLEGLGRYWTRLHSRISNNYRKHVTRSVSISLPSGSSRFLHSLLYSMSLMFVASSRGGRAYSVRSASMVVDRYEISSMMLVECMVGVLSG